MTKLACGPKGLVFCCRRFAPATVALLVLVVVVVVLVVLVVLGNQITKLKATLDVEASRRLEPVVVGNAIKPTFLIKWLFDKKQENRLASRSIKRPPGKRPYPSTCN